MTAINFPPLSRGGRIFTDFAMCNCFSKNLGLKEAAKREVGTGANQIPDMNSFTSGTGWQKLPGGLIIQWCTVSIPPVGWANPVNGWSQSPNISVNLPIPFPNAVVASTASLINGGTALEWIQTHHINFSQTGLNLTAHALGVYLPNQTVQYSVITLGY